MVVVAGLVSVTMIYLFTYSAQGWIEYLEGRRGELASIREAFYDLLERFNIKRRYVDKLSSSPTKDDLYQELNEANARLLHSEGETQKVKAIMSAQCNATICSYTQSFRKTAAHVFRALLGHACQ